MEDRGRSTQRLSTKDEWIGNINTSINRRSLLRLPMKSSRRLGDTFRNRSDGESLNRQADLRLSALAFHIHASRGYSLNQRPAARAPVSNCSSNAQVRSDSCSSTSGAITAFRLATGSKAFSGVLSSNTLQAARNRARSLVRFLFRRISQPHAFLTAASRLLS